MSNSAIFDGWAEAYDTIHRSDGATVWDGRDIEFYSREAEQADGNVLEIGCGSGRVYLELLEDGHDVHGIDASRDQLRVLRAKANERGLTPEVRRADMRSFDLPGSYELIIVPYNTFRHNLTMEDQLDTLNAIKNHLTKGGRAVIEFLSPELLYSDEETVVTSEFTHEGDEYFLIKSFRVSDDIDQILRFKQKLFRNGCLVSENDYRYARIYKREFIHSLQRVGFEDWDLYGDFDRQPIEPNGMTQNMIWELHGPR